MKQMKEFIIRNKKWIILFLCITIFLVFAQTAFQQQIVNADIAGYNIVSKYIISDFTTPIAKFITNFGGAIFLVTITILLLLIIKNKKIKLSILCNFICVALLNLLLKTIVQRPRPTGYRLVEESGFSFPSGHSMIGLAFYSFLIYLIYKYVENRKLKIALISILGALVVIVGFSRIYLGVHYISDVIGGFLISITYLIIYIKIAKKFIFKDGGKI